MGRRANILCGVVEYEVIEVNKFAIDPQRGTGVGEVGALNKALADRRTGDALVETSECGSGLKSRPHQGCHADFRDIITH